MRSHLLVTIRAFMNLGVAFFLTLTDDNVFFLQEYTTSSLNNCHRWCACYKFDSIYRKYVYHLYFQKIIKN